MSLCQRVGLISCVKEKADSVRTAEDLYVSPYFRKMRHFVEATCDGWRILSAKYGLVDPSTTLEPYEMTLKTMKRLERRAWAERVASQLQAEFPRPGEVTFELHAGREYSRDLVPLLKTLGYAVEEPVPSLSFGKRLQWYDRNTPARREKATD